MKNNELFTLAPNLKQFYGRTITKEMEFDESNEPLGEDDKKVHQTLKDCVLTTEVTQEYEVGGIKVKRNEHSEETLPEGTILIWDEREGYILPQYKFYKIADLEEEIKEIKGIYKDNTDMNPKGE